MCARSGKLAKASTVLHAGAGVSALALFLALSASPASAASLTWTVGPSSPETVTGRSSDVQLTDEGETIGRCTQSTITAELGDSSGAGEIGSITQASFSGCTGLLGSLTLTGNASQTAPWILEPTSYSGGTSLGYVTGVSVTVSIPTFTCTFDATGIANFTYSNAIAVLSLQSTTLVTSNATAGCAGFVSNGDPAGFSADYALTTTPGTATPTITAS